MKNEEKGKFAAWLTGRNRQRNRDGCIISFLNLIQRFLSSNQKG
jgi:hypothetical protein